MPKEKLAAIPASLIPPAGMIYDPAEPYKGMVYLHLYHGRNTPEEDLDDWGFDGGFTLCHCVGFTYENLWLILPGEEERTELAVVNGCVEWKGKWYGDFEIVAAIPVPTQQFEVQTDMMGDWENCWTIDGQPQYFDSEAEAVMAIDKHIADCEAAVTEGNMQDAPTREEFRVMEVTNEKTL